MNPPPKLIPRKVSPHPPAKDNAAITIIAIIHAIVLLNALRDAKYVTVAMNKTSVQAHDANTDQPARIPNIPNRNATDNVKATVKRKVLLFIPPPF
jgi:hypothetical protein